MPKRKFNYIFAKLTRLRLLWLIPILLVLALLPIFSGNITKNEPIQYVKQATKDTSVELNDFKTVQTGVNGETSVTYRVPKTFFNILFGGTSGEGEKVSSTVTKTPVPEVIANGTLKYQYMYCSNGNYSYFTDNQFKDEKVGFTHKSKDYCVENGEGTVTSLASVPPSARTSARSVVTPFYFPSSTYSQPTGTAYQGAAPIYVSPTLKEYTVPAAPKITVSSPTKSSQTCTYYQGNGVCFNN